jgi:hypothetical protein
LLTELVGELEASIKVGELKERVLLDPFGEDFSEEDEEDVAARLAVTGLVVGEVIFCCCELCCFEF